MSGPIVRKYGFPNFEKIFGERKPQHGVEEEAPAAAGKKPADAERSKEPAPAKEAPPGGSVSK